MYIYLWPVFERYPANYTHSLTLWVLLYRKGALGLQFFVILGRFSDSAMLNPYERLKKLYKWIKPCDSKRILDPLVFHSCSTKLNIQSTTIVYIIFLWNYFKFLGFLVLGFFVGGVFCLFVLFCLCGYLYIMW